MMNFLALFGTSIRFVGGVFVGSFLNVISDRLESGKNIFFGRSECEACKKPLSPLELIPVLSYFIQKGRCKSCREKISAVYPFSEILTGLSFMGVFMWLKLFDALTLEKMLLFSVYIVITSLLLIILFSDMKFMLVPDKIVIPAILFVLAFRLLDLGYYAWNLYYRLTNDSFGKYLLKAGFWQSHVAIESWELLYTLIASLVIAVFFLLLIVLTKGRGMGGGDVKLGFLIGLVVGFPASIVAIFLAFVLGALYSVGLVLLKKKSVKDAIPFGPFLILGCFIALFFGQSLIQWYLKLS